MGISADASKFSLVPIQRFPELIDQTIQLINEEWPRSIGARLHSLNSSKENALPTCLILTNLSNSKNDKSSSIEPTVLAHLKLTPIPSLPLACFVESVVVWKKLRGQGIGRYLMNEAERYCKNNLKIYEIYLSTIDKEDFYHKLGYEPCEPVSIFGGPSSFPFRPATNKKKYMKKVLVEISSDEEQ